MIWHRKAQEHLEAEAQAKMKIQELREAAKKHKQWYKEQLDRERESSRDTETNLNKAMARLEGLHGQEANLWQEIKTRYELKANASASKIQHLKLSLEELKAKTEMGIERIWTLFHSHRDKFSWQLKEAMDRGWADWARQAVKFHTYRADQEDRRKEGKGFYNLD